MGVQRELGRIICNLDPGKGRRRETCSGTRSVMELEGSHLGGLQGRDQKEFGSRGLEEVRGESILEAA